MSARALVALLAGTSLVACGGDPEPKACGSSGRTVSSVVTFATFGEEQEDGSVEGVDVDGIVSDGSDEAGCYQVDFVSPEGIPGIDNQVATLLPVVEGLVGSENIDALLGAAITNGQLIIAMSVRGVDDLRNDACVDVAFGAGLGAPLLDGSGRYLPYQTFGWDREAAPVSVIGGARIEEGVLLGGPGELVLPVRVLDAAFSLAIHSGGFRLKVEPDPEGDGASLAGYVGGGIVVEELAKVVESFNIGEGVKGAVVPLLATRADLAMDGEGTCRQISAALRFETTPSFALED